MSEAELLDVVYAFSTARCGGLSSTLLVSIEIALPVTDVYCVPVSIDALQIRSYASDGYLREPAESTYEHKYDDR